MWDSVLLAVCLLSMSACATTGPAKEATLAGHSVLIIGDSHVYTPHGFIVTLHEELMERGAAVLSYGMCGTTAKDWVNKQAKVPCGSAVRKDDGPVERTESDAGKIMTLPEMVGERHPDLIVVVIGDTMAAYSNKNFPVPWISGEVSALTAGIQASGAKCVWVGPWWGSEGGKFGKYFTRVKEMSDLLENIVSPCAYINSLTMAKQGEWETMPGDGQHLLEDGYKEWGAAVAKEIDSLGIFQKNTSTSQK